MQNSVNMVVSGGPGPSPSSWLALEIYQWMGNSISLTSVLVGTTVEVGESMVQVWIPKVELHKQRTLELAARIGHRLMLVSSGFRVDWQLY